MSAAVKRRRLLSELAGLKFISHSALSAILRRLDASGELLPEGGASRFTIARAVNDQTSLATAHGQLFQTVEICLSDGATFTWEFPRPAALLSWMCESSPLFDTQLFELYACCPCTTSAPWSIVVYTDEAAPGALLRGDNTRKSHLWYWSFQEFGMGVLSREDAWFFGGLPSLKHISTVWKS